MADSLGTAAALLALVDGPEDVNRARAGMAGQSPGQRRVGVDGSEAYRLLRTTMTTAVDNAVLPNSSSAASAGLRDLMARMGHDSERAAMNYQHEARDADKAITDAHVDDEHRQDNDGDDG